MSRTLRATANMEQVHDQLWLWLYLAPLAINIH